MTDPVLKSLPSDVAQLLEEERQTHIPPEGSMDRVLSRVSASLGIPAGVTGGGGGQTGGSAKAGGGPPAPAGGAETISATGSLAARAIAVVLKPATLVAFAVGMAAGVGTTALMDARDPRSADAVPTAPRDVHAAPPIAPPEKRLAVSPLLDPSLLRPPLPTPPHEVTPREPSLSRGTQARRASRRRAPSKRVSPKNGRATGLAAERHLLEVARTALARNRPADALAALTRHRKRFPRGNLAEERMALTVLSLAARGEHARARSVARRFKELYPGSMLQPAVERSLRRRPAAAP